MALVSGQNKDMAALKKKAPAETIGSALQQGSILLQNVTDRPRLEAELLLSHTMGVSRTTLLAYPERPLPASDYHALVHRRAAGVPLPHLTGRIEFYGMEFTLTPDVLIPRPETEQLVTLALARQPQVVVDVGTGSGCIAVTLAIHMPQARIYGIDLSAPALRVAAINARRHSVQNRVQWLQADLIQPLAGPVDWIVSNPPYVAQTEWTALPDSVRQHEPRLALDGGSDGLAAIRRLLTRAGRILSPGGGMLIEIGAAQGAAVLALAHSLWPQAHTILHQDLAGRDRILEIVH